MDRRVTLCRLYTAAWKGSDDPLKDNAPACKVVSVERALTSEFTGDVMILSYAPGSADIDAMPRLSVPALARLHLETKLNDTDRYGGVQLNIAMIDVDAPNHQPPPEGWTEGVLAAARSAGLAFGWYRTPNGLRLVYLPREPVSILLADSYLTWLCARLVKAGVPIDETTDQALRLQRAPRALRRDLPRDFSDLKPLDDHPSAAELVTRDATALAEVVAYAPGSMPTREFNKGELKCLKGALNELELEDLRTGRYRVAAGDRHGTLVRLACAIAEGFNTTDPAIPYGLLVKSAQEMFNTPEDQGRNWRAEVERICTWACAIVGGRAKYQVEEETTARKEAAAQLGVAPSEVKRRLLISSGATIHVYNERTGRYDLSVAKRDEVLMALRQACPRLIGTAIYDGRSVSELLRDYGSPAEEVTYTYTPRQPQYDPNTLSLYVDACTVCDDLVARYHPEVQEWLEALGGPLAHKLLDWLAAAPRLDRPTCALYLHGGASSGKSMLGAGLARIWSKVSDHVRYKDAVGEFQHKLKKYPLIFADEKATAENGKTDTAQFRIIIGNSGLTINQKFRDVAFLDGAPRLLIAANNADAFQIREELDHDDVGAITLRVGYIQVDADAAIATLERLAREAGTSSTREYTDSWVKGGKIAEHILFLFETRDFRPGNRLLVEGWESPWTRTLGAKAGSAAAVCLIAAKAVLDGKKTDAVRWFDGSFYFSSMQLSEEWETLVPGKTRDATAPGAHRLAMTLKNLSNGAPTRRMDRRFGASSGKRSQATYFVVDATTIAELVEEMGIMDADEVKSAASRPSDAEKSTARDEGAESPEDALADAKRGILHGY